MRTLALALAAALPVWLAAPAAEAVCTSGVDCIRERFGIDGQLRDNRILDRTDRVGTRAPLNPYVARQGGPATGPSRSYAGPGVDRQVVAPGARREVEPGIWYTPEGAPVQDVPGAATDAETPRPTVEPYAPAEAASGPATGAARAAQRPTSPYAEAMGDLRRPVPPPRDPNRPSGAADLRYSGPQTGANR